MVNFSSNNSKLNKKRGISTIVGGIIFLVLLTAGFSAFFVAMDVQSDTIDAQRTISDSLIDKTQEQFAIAVATDETNNNQLGIHVKIGENATIALRVTNIGPSPITNITPDFNPPQIDQPPGWLVANQIVSPLSYDLIPGESAIFTWHVRLSTLGTVGDKIQFTDSVTGTESATGYTVSSNT